MDDIETIESEDSRRHKLYFRINDQDPYGIGKLPTSVYVKLKHNDQSAYDFIWQLFKSNKIPIEDGKITALFRSTDDVDYLNEVFLLNFVEPSVQSSPLNLPPKKLSSEVSSSAITGSCSTISSNVEKEPELSMINTSESQDTRNKAILQTETAEPTDSDDEINESVQSRQQLSRSKKASQVWQHFNKENYSTARCIICYKVLKHCGNTTNLKQHLNRKHALLCSSLGQRKRKQSSESSNESSDNWSEVKKMKFQAKEKRLYPIDEAFERVNSFADGGKAADKITNAILYMVAVDEMPFSTVENEGFKSLLKTVAPLYSVSSRRTLTKLIDSRYTFLKERYKNNLQQFKSYSLTCDVWTDVSNQSYLGVSIHYLSNDVEMKAGCLGVVPLYENHTADYLTTALNFVIDDFQLDRTKIMAIVSDSGANIKKAVHNTIGKDKHLTCFAHLLSHLVPDGLTSMPALTAIISKVKNIVTLTRRSVVASDELKRLQIRDGKSDGTALKFIQDVPTRWNTTLYMLERFVLLEEYVYPVLLKSSNPPDMLRREEVQIITDIISLMKPVENVIREISGDAYPTCSIIIPIIHCMEATINHIVPETKLGIEFKKSLQTAITFRFKNFELNSILGVATILDPRFKKIHFESALAASTAITRINQRIERIEKASVQKKTSERDTPSHTEKGIWEFHDDLMSRNSDSSIHSESPNLEIRQYLSQPVISRLKNPFVHWKSLEQAFPALLKIAMQYLSVVGTSVPAERMFSHAGLIKTDNRNRLTGEHLNKLLFLSAITREEWGMV